MYATSVIVVLVSMVVTGAARSVAVKLFYQLGFTSPLFVTLLYLLGQSFSLLVYLISKKIKNQRNIKQVLQDDDPEGGNPVAGYKECKEYPMDSKIQKKLAEERELDVFDDEWMLSDAVRRSFVFDTSGYDDDRDHDLDTTDTDGSAADAAAGTLAEKLHPPLRVQQVPVRIPNRQGSATGLSDEPNRGVKFCVNRIPWYLKPAIPGFCNLCNAAMRWASLLFISASVAEILISGLELVLSVIAARTVRSRHVSKTRWMGVAIVTLGVVIVGTLHAFQSTSGDLSGQRDTLIGVLLIVGQCIMSVIQDIAEEVFMDEAGFPATLLLGMEGLFGLGFGLMLYFPMANLFGEDVSVTWDTLKTSPLNAEYTIFLPFLFTLTGIFNIMATGATSSMTRNVWKNLRTVLVWVFSLLIYYCTTSDLNLGEPWVIPGSFYILFGFCLMLSGIYVYYSNA